MGTRSEAAFRAQQRRYFWLKSPAELGDAQRLPVGGGRSSASIIMRRCAVFAAAALSSAVIVWAIVGLSTTQVADEAAPAAVPAPSISVSPNNHSSQAEAEVPLSVPNQHAKINEPAPQAASDTVPPSPPSQVSVSRKKDPSQAETAVPPSVPNQLTKTNEPAPLSEATSAATVLPSKPSQVASVQSGAAPISGPQLTPAQVGGTATHLDAEEIATLVNRGTDYIKSGDLASARLLLRRAAEAGSASAALMLGTTYDPLSIQQLGAIGVVPDVAQARQWYEKAAALGSDAASQRLAKLAHPSQ